MKNDQKKYDTSQEIFYKVCETGWSLCTHHLNDFAEFKPYYTQAYINDAMQAVRNAEKLSGNNQWRSSIKEIRINLVKAGRQVQYNWQMLKQYITVSYPGATLEIKIDLAGGALYKKASLHNWSSLRTLIGLANNFITKEFENLTAAQICLLHSKQDLL